MVKQKKSFYLNLPNDYSFTKKELVSFFLLKLFKAWESRDKSKDEKRQKLTNPKKKRAKNSDHVSSINFLLLIDQLEKEEMKIHFFLRNYALRIFEEVKYLHQ